MRRFFGLHSASGGTRPPASVAALILCLAASVVATAMQPCPQRTAGDDAPSRTVAVAPASGTAAAQVLDEGASCTGGWAPRAAVDPATLRAPRAEEQRATADPADGSLGATVSTGIETASPPSTPESSRGATSLHRVDASVDRLQTVVLLV